MKQKALYPLLTLVAFFVLSCNTLEKKQSLTETERWEQHATNTEIIRDDFGVPHIYGKTDADAVFGLLYAQCEDDFNRVEHNYLWATGRLAEVEGESSLYSDLRANLFMTQSEAIENFNASPDWLKKLCIAFADGINYYLATHPEVKPRLITHFEPWMPMYFSEGSIGGDIERVPLDQIQAFYDVSSTADLATASNYFITPSINDKQGSNGFAISGTRTASGNAMLLINPHTSFFFRGEVHVVSEEGLNAYGAVTWGQFFVYQGFNEKTGWMHTSTGSDIIDQFEETIAKKDGALYYKYGEELRPIDSTKVDLKYIDGGEIKKRSFTFYRTHHGPVTHKSGDKWVSTALMWNPVKALEQSFTRTKKSNQKEFKEMMTIRTNSSNNTVYADSDGNIAYYHGNFIPKRDSRFDYTKPVDGSDPQTDWQGLHSVDENIFVLNPETGWIQNCNSTPFTCAGEFSPKREDYPVYMTSFPENFRGVHAIDLLSQASNLDLDGLIELAYDPYIPFAAAMIPDIVEAYKLAPNKKVAPAIAILKDWDYKVSKESKAMTLLKYYMRVYYKLNKDRDYNSFMELPEHLANTMTAESKMDYLAQAMDWIESDFGSWQLPWGEFNRYQRLNGEIRSVFNDSLQSIPIGMAPGNWGALASFGARTAQGTKRQYGMYGNSFVAVVEFGEKVEAKSILAGGQSGDPDSEHFDDQALPYANRDFKQVAYYREDVLKRAESQYHPGE